MSSIPKDLILIHIGSHATIPTGWSREITLDDKHAKAWGAENPNITGGAATHTHTSPTHSHALNAHTHTYTLSTIGDHFPDHQTGSGSQNPCHEHGHSTSTSGALSGGTTTADAVTYGAMSNDPPYRKVIFIKANTGAQLATDMVALWNSNTPPSNWSNVTEFQGRYLKGAGTGADADLSTDNGSTTNSHGITHTHTAQTHTHVAANSASAPDTNDRNGQGGANCVVDSHYHSVTLAASTQGINQNTDTLVTAETVEPAYTLLQAIKKGATGRKEIGLIGLWLGTVASIPKGWVICDGNNGTKDCRNKFIKIGNPAGANGGSNTHIHAAQAHLHTGNGTHTHTGSASAHVNGEGRNGSGQGAFVAGEYEHTVDYVSSPTTNYDNANTTADSSDNQPAYRTAVYIQFIKESGGGAFIFNIL